MRSPYVLVLRDVPADKKRSSEPTEEHFNDLYHLFLAKISRLPIDHAPTLEQEERLTALFQEVLAYKRELERSGIASISSAGTRVRT